MKLLDNLQRRFGRYALPHVTEGLIACQVLTYVFCMTKPEFSESLAMIPARVMQGEVWRLVTFLCEPPLSNPLWAFFFWYFFYLTGTVLEGTWGTFRYNVYLLVGWFLTVVLSFVDLAAPASAGFLQASVFLAFAYLYPDFQVQLYFIFPIKVKWLAMLQWASYLWILTFGDLSAQLMVAAAIGNFILFFWHDIAARMRSGQWRMTQQARQIRQARLPRHTCSVCGVTNLSDPKASFRYCSTCAGAPCYCMDHIHTHAHIVAVKAEVVEDA
jgi:hypothetical protein